ncbi:hypothetical protein C5F49_03115 [Nitrosopumilus oxyclinae]|uniref:Uncharacterized protein n=1 Tax=Nitrosopumilus oxyclinae TaxID=1959104 RepID=A0A7D5M3S7_9ARCH|nr:hypothetical protein [Nitrosopumilus oxyclinae]QLH05535.1 hypothetical protein C5F49_03115 [Nitrosopumilus oxyclinae]
MDNTSKDSEFKIQLSTEDINKIDEELKGADNISKPLEISNEKNKTIKIDESQSTVKGLRLLNVCSNCENKFIPKNSMMNEKLCKSCLEK